MNNSISAFFIRRPVATTLLTIGIALAGAFAFRLLPVSPLPQVDFPTISVQATMPGASPDNMASSVASPLEKHLGQIADVTEMTSQSALGSARITLQFGLDRDINGAARDVQAAINAARADLPTSLRSNPIYRKVNPADSPIMIIALTSPTRTQGQLYDAASNVMQQRLSQLTGIGEVDVGGSALPAVRIELNPGALFKYGVGLEDVRAALASANANSPKGAIEDDTFHYQIYTNDQASHADQYRDLVVAYRNNAAIKLTDIGEVNDSVEDLRNAGLSNGKPSVLVILFRQPGANIIDAVDAVKAELPRLAASLPGDVDLTVTVDRSKTIRISLADTEKTLVISVALVTLVVFLFLRNLRAAAIPSIAVPVSIVGTFGAMYLLGFSLDNLSLMALTISTGFVVDDAIVVLENISRHMELGATRMEAALVGAREVGFTVISISISLVAVFLPILLMGSIIGRLFREFAITLSMAVAISLFISLTATPMMCSRFLPNPADHSNGWLYRVTERGFDAMQNFYRRTLTVALRHSLIVALVLISTIGLNVYLFANIAYGLFPAQDTGLLIGNIQGDQSISFQAMKLKLAQLQSIVQADPAVDSVAGFTGGRQTNSGSVFVSLKSVAERGVSADVVVNRLRGKLAQVPGAVLRLQAAADLRTGGRQSNAMYQFTLQSDDSATLYRWAPRLTAAMQKIDVLTDVNSDQQQGGLLADLNIDRPTVARLGLSLNAIDNTLYDAFGQRQVSTIYAALNQYHVVMEVAPRYWQDPQTLKDIWVSTSGANPSGTQSTNATAGTFSASSAATSTASTIAADSARNLAINSIAATGHSSASAGSSVSTSQETMIPLAAFAHFGSALTPLGINHQGPFVATTISFNLAPGHALSEAQQAIKDAMVDIRMPATVRGSFAGTALTYQQSLANEPLLIAAALAAVYIVLGVLYESYIHPLTIISTLPSASVGALLAMKMFNTEFTIIALIGIILLIGIVKKNAIMMIDFALQAQRAGLAPPEAIFQACMLRFRPIMMTTFAALLGALPLAFGTGEGSELRHPLGISIVGGLIVSQALTLYTTPVIYLYLDRLSQWLGRLWNRVYLGQPGDHGAAVERHEA
ncbi:efflux RND transporter permease subunit [Methylocapsa sp. S129]|uniref:efflux RND transporter permease subunit n=1 Tax=Methylocapsa sp. S129 TaxID=1641869 RepID=UPI00131AA2AF|nr:efflux RND transporter permease subunit [Methylocapsa sp. S129]